MKIIELFEESNPEEREQEIDIVAERCQPYLQEIKGSKNLLWSGRKIGSDFVTKLPFQPKRRPANTPKVVHEIFDNEFESQLGVKFRSQAFFVTGEMEIADNYGTPGLLFPIGDYKYCWNPDIEDLYEFIIKDQYHKQAFVKKMMDYGHRQQMGDRSPALDEWWEEDGQFKAMRWAKLVVSHYRTDGLKEAIASKKEIMLHCPKGAYWINLDQDFSEEELDHMQMMWNLPVKTLDSHFQDLYTGYA